MGTAYGVTLAGVLTGTETEVVRALVERALGTVDAHMSTFRADSDVRALDRAQAGVWVPMSSHTREVVDDARRIHALSGGAFDPTVGELVSLWGFGPAHRQARLPTEQLIAAARGRGGMHGIEVDAAAGALRATRRGATLDLSGIAKGYAVDLVAAALERAGIASYLVDVGGELRAGGAPARGGPWHVGIEHPVPGSRAVQMAVVLDEEAISTSGDYRNFFQRGGQRYSHTIDPRTGHPVRHRLASVSVIAPNAMEADALSTAFMVLGPDEGLALARQLDVAALFLSHGTGGAFEPRMTRGFAARLLG
jgi:thiamine biosynthesis lipoprotein